MAARFRLEPLFSATASTANPTLQGIFMIPSAFTKAPPPVLLPRGAEKMMPLAVTFLLGNLSVDQFPICLM